MVSPLAPVTFPRLDALLTDCYRHEDTIVRRVSTLLSVHELICARSDDYLLPGR
jgi:hypothetical protein